MVSRRTRLEIEGTGEVRVRRLFILGKARHQLGRALRIEDRLKFVGVIHTKAPFYRVKVLRARETERLRRMNLGHNPDWTAQRCYSACIFGFGPRRPLLTERFTATRSIKRVGGVLRLVNSFGGLPAASHYLADALLFDLLDLSPGVPKLLRNNKRIAPQ